MARLLFAGSSVAASKTSGVHLGIASFIMCVVAVIACASHGRRWRRFFPVGRQSNNPVILSMNQVQPGVEGDGCIWRRSIIMGEKCQYPEFSGVITYDSDGNIVRPSGTSALQPWKV